MLMFSCLPILFQFLFVVCNLINNYWAILEMIMINHKNAASQLVSRLWLRQSKAFERSVKRVRKTLLLSTASFHFSSISNRQCRVLQLFVNPYWNFVGIFSNKVDNCLLITVCAHFSSVSGQSLITV